MSEFSELLTGGISDIRNDIRDLHGVAASTLARVASVETDVAELKRRSSPYRFRRIGLITGLVSLGAAVAKLLPGLSSKP
jgi:hypothetical protein